MSDHIKISRKLIALVLAFIASSSLFTPLSPGSEIRRVYAQNCPAGEFPGELDDILDNPEIFIGCKIQIQGILEREEKEGRTTYSLRTGSDRTLEIWPWAPEGDQRSRVRLRAQGITRTMPSFTGRQLRITGRLVQERSGNVVMEVSFVEELGEHIDGEMGALDEEEN